MDPASVLSLIVIAVAAVFTSITAPLILARRTERMHREDQLADYQRQDQVAKVAAETAAAAALQVQEVATLAAEAAARLEAAQAESIRRTDEVARLTASQAVQTDRKLDAIDAQAKRIHTLVNSDMTAARQSELDQTRAMVAVLRRVTSLAQEKGTAPDPRDMEALSTADARVGELEQILADRLHQLHQVEDEARAHPIDDDG
jgi:polyhydroxyalkanoate synthesis regulator phasin